MADVQPIVIPDTEEQCIEVLKAVRWPEGCRCPRCGSSGYYEISGRRLPLYECASCRYQYSVISGTIMERSRVPLRKWFQAIDIMSRTGMTAGRLSAKIAVTYKTAWLMMHKLREAIAGNNEAQLLTGLIRFEMGMTGRQSVPSLHGLHPTETPFIIGGATDGDGRVRQVAVRTDDGGDTHSRRITVQGASRFIDRHVDLRRAVVDLSTDGFGRTNVRPLRELAYRIEREANRYSGWRKNLNHYVQEAVYRCNIRLAEAAPFGTLLKLAAACHAPTNDAVKARPVPGRPDWRSGRNINRLSAELKAFASGLLTQVASNFGDRGISFRV